jgi:pseudouridine-5'-monophosphatase
MQPASFLNGPQLPYTPEEYFAITSKKQAEKWPKTQFMAGALELLKHLKEHEIPMALATSSHKKNYDLKTAHLKYGFDLFGGPYCGRGRFPHPRWPR